MVTAPTPAHGRSSRACVSLPNPCLLLGASGTLASTVLMGGESHGVYTRGPRPKFHFLTLPSRFPSRQGSSKRGGRSAVGSLRAEGTLGTGWSSSVTPRCPPSPRLPPARCGCSSGLAQPHARGKYCWVLGRGWAAPPREPLNRAPLGETKSLPSKGFSKGSRKPPTVEWRNWAR